MEVIYYELDSVLGKPLEESVSAIGFFDGIHRGHMQLINKAKEEAKKKNIKSSMITFSPSPASVLANQKEQLLTTITERIHIAEQIGIDQFIVLKFTKSLSQLSPDDFHSKIIDTLNIKHIVCGEDFRYGFKGSGSVSTLKEYQDIDLSVINDYKDGDERISSSRIKENISKKELDVANELLGYSYFIEGYVKHGRKKGRTIGFPTINLNYSESKYLLNQGIYIGYTEIKGKRYISTINVGYNPTINTVEHKSIESFVHDFNEDVYKEKVKFVFLKKIRPEIKFNNVQELIDQMNNDIKESEDYFTSKMRRRHNIETI